MKNKWLTLVVCIVVVISMNSQIKPDTFYGRLNMSSLADQDFTQTSLSIGVFFTDDFLMGFSVPLNYNVLGESETIGSEAFSISLLTKYYFNISSSEKLKLFLEAEAGGGRYAYQKSMLGSFKYGGGISWFVHPKISIDLNAMYGYLYVDPKSAETFFASTDIFKGFEPSIGVSIYL